MPVADRGDVTLLGPVVGLETARLLGPCVLGQPGADPDAGPLVLGPGVTVRAFAVLYAGSRLGAGVHVGHGALVREGNVIGDGASIGSGVHVEPGNVIGARSRIQSGCFLASATLGEDVFLGPHVVFTDDPHPPCPTWPACRAGVVVEDGASVGGNVTLLPGVRLGAGCLVGGGSVVTRSVEAGAIVAGNPARPMGRRERLRCRS
jgi:acetyltransferase-like isoleucine patch superfamily enzyme